MKAKFRGSEREFAQNKNQMKPTHVGCHAILLLVLLFAGKLFAADMPADFNAANKLYAAGKFADAANAYEKILATGAASPSLLFNSASAEFKAGHAGRAVAALRRAESLAPRDPEIRANLNFVRSHVSGVTLRESFWQNGLRVLTLNEWTLLAAGAFWLAWILLAARQLRPALAARLKNTVLFFAALAIFAGAMVGVQASNHFSRSVAMVTLAEATARSGPFDEAQSAFTVRDGAELLVLDRHDDWIQVADGSGKTGWLNQKQVEVLPGA